MASQPWSYSFSSYLQNMSALGHPHVPPDISSKENMIQTRYNPLQKWSSEVLLLSRRISVKLFLCFVVAFRADINECDLPRSCSGIPYSVCANTIGGFSCVCPTGRTFNADRSGCIGACDLALSKCIIPFLSCTLTGLSCPGNVSCTSFWFHHACS